MWPDWSNYCKAISSVSWTEKRASRKDSNRLSLSIWSDAGSCQRMVAITTANLPSFLKTNSSWSFRGNAHREDVCISHTSSACLNRHGRGLHDSLPLNDVSYVSKVTSALIGAICAVMCSTPCRKLTKFIERQSLFWPHFLSIHMLFKTPVTLCRYDL